MSFELTVEGFTLIGREWLQALGNPEVQTIERSVYGNKTFETLAFSEPCGARRLWGYACPFERAEIAADHLFPRSLGGPTDPRNRLTLCRWHNTAKSMDIHIYPWEEGIPEWLPQLLGVLSRWLRPAV